MSGDCWLWTGAVGGMGYGSIGVGSRTDGTRGTRRAHRVAYELERGYMPRDVDIHHECGNTLCVRPSHLVAITRSEHIRKHDGPTAVNARKETCPKCKTPLEYMSGGRRCRKCRNEYMREYKRSRRSDAYWDDVRKIERTFA